MDRRCRAGQDDPVSARALHHLDDGVDVGSVGPGWEYYLDALDASRDERDVPKFDDYYPAQQQYYQELEPS